MTEDGLYIDWKKVNDNLVGMTDGRPCTIVAASYVDVLVMQCVNDVCGTQYHPVLASTILATLKMFCQQNKTMLVIVSITEEDNYNEVLELCNRAHELQIEAINCIVCNAFIERLIANNGDGVRFVRGLYNQFALDKKHPYQQYPEIRYKIKENYPINSVLPSILAAYNDGTQEQYSCYEVPEGVMVVSRKEIFYTFQKVLFTSDETAHELIIIPICSCVVPSGVDACRNMLSMSYIREEWGEVFRRIDSETQNRLQANSSYLADLINYVYAFNFLVSTNYQMFTYLASRVTWRPENMQLSQDNLYALVGDWRLTESLAHQLSDGYHKNYRLIENNLLRQYEQEAIAHGESVSGLNPAFDLATQIRLATTVSKAACTEEILAACYTVSEDSSSYTIEALNRAAMSSLNTEETYVELYDAENKWVDKQMYRGSVILQNEVVNGLWITKFKKGMNEFVYPQQIGRLAATVLARAQKKLKLQTISEGMFHMMLATLLSLEEDFKLWAASMQIQISRDKVELVIKGGYAINIVRYLVENHVLVGGEEQVTVSEYWRSRKEWISLGTDETFAKKLYDALDTLLAPFEYVPIHLYPIVFNAYWFHEEDVYMINSEMNYHYQGLCGLVESIQQSWNNIQEVDIKSMSQECHKLWAEVQPYIVDWSMVESMRSRIEDEHKYSLFVETQVIIQKINFVIRLLMVLLYYRDILSANEMIKGGNQHFMMNGKDLIDVSVLIDAITQETEGDRYKQYIDAIVKFTQQKTL